MKSQKISEIDLYSGHIGYTESNSHVTDNVAQDHDNIVVT